MSAARRGTISIIGAGRVGRALGRALHRRGWRIGAVMTTSAKSARAAAAAIGAGTPRGAITADVFEAEVVLICTPDSRIGDAAFALARAVTRPARRSPLRGKFVLHVSGAQDSSALAPLARLGAAVGSMHPFQTFGVNAWPDFRGLLFTVEGRPRARRMARRIVREMGGLPVEISAAAKPAYHGAGAFAAAHILTLVEAATQALVSLGFPRSTAQRALVRMARETLNNLEQLGPRATWTGPLPRGDYSTIARHFASFRRFSPELRAAHAALLRLSARVLSRAPEKMLRQLEASMRKQRQGANR